MKIPNAILVIMLFSQLLTSGEEKESGSTREVKLLPAVYCTSRSIEGTTLETEDTIQHDEDKGWSLHQCQIGYIRRVKNSSRMSPVLDLPSLVNDRYWVKFSNGSMIVTAHKANKMIVTLHIDGIVPNMITNPQIQIGENIVEWKTQDPSIKPKATDLNADKSKSYDFDDIEGTTLSICHALPTAREPEKSAPLSVIGYKRESEERSTFTPVLSLPHLENDRYVVKLTKGSLFVKTKSHGEHVVELNLENLAPSAITVLYGEQAGADQPATKPADKPPVKDQPSTPTSKDAPR
jgi:hypothetical protein